MKIGYARVSTGDQNLDLQRHALGKAGCLKVYEEKCSGIKSRPQLHAALRAARRGDVLVVWKLDRLGRSLQDLIKIISGLEKRGIGFCSISDTIDTTTPTGKLVFHITGAIAEFERALISERTKAGLDAARRKGKIIGRPRRLTTSQIARARSLSKDRHVPMAEIARMLNVGKTTVWRAVSAPEGVY